MDSRINFNIFSLFLSSLLHSEVGCGMFLILSSIFLTLIKVCTSEELAVSTIFFKLFILSGITFLGRKSLSKLRFGIFSTLSLLVLTSVKVFEVVLKTFEHKSQSSYFECVDLRLICLNKNIFVGFKAYLYVLI